MWKLYEPKSRDRFPYSLGFVLVDPLQKYFCAYYSLKNFYNEVNNFEFDHRYLTNDFNKQQGYSLLIQAKSRISLINDYPELFL
jgi:hypothetical protein